MKKYLLVFLLSIIPTGFTLAQTPADSITIVSTKWKTEKLKKGVLWKSAQIKLYNSPQSINILEIKPSKKNKLGIAFCVDTLITTSSFCEQINAIAGVNASFFDMKNGGSVDYMKVDGQVIHQGRETVNNSNSAIIINGKSIAIVRLPNGNTEARDLEGTDVMVAGPMLVSSYTIENLPESSFNTTRHPRTCAAITSKGRILLITVDGRHKGKAEGMNTKELAYLVKILDAKDAMNFDGGGSTAMYVKDFGENGIASYPSDNKLFDHKGERRVANIVYVK
ncbi:MAG: phosphodiester glycosidase family protein [Prevotellaceae bacterium]|jgi:exopolysaccharide biosynthesis protein|nr:phosphodiester glycosidase family protein [Prevotellaceae bacterium]